MVDPERRSSLSDALALDTATFRERARENFYAGAEDGVDEYLRPLEVRLAADSAPADWKPARARSHLDAGDDVAAPIHAAQRDYFERQAETLFDGTFADWLA